MPLAPAGSSFLTPAVRWRAVLDRAAAADGQFWYAVRTTGVFCRPGCKSRRPRRENVVFFDAPYEALEAGFRACRRCRPLGTQDLETGNEHLAAVVEACRRMDQSEGPSPLAELAAAAGVSRAHFLRLFRAHTGLTPKAYEAAQRQSRLRVGLAAGQPVTAALYGAGYSSAGRCYEETQQSLGMTPTAFRAQGAGQTIRFALGECSLGSILVAATQVGLCAVSLGDDPQQLLVEFQEQFAGAELVGGDREFERLMAEVIGVVDGQPASRDLPLDLQGTAFQTRIWRLLRDIPLGQTTTYTALARRLRRPAAVRAVARACAANPLAVVVPCHRVVRRDGALAGYRWGLERKARLLAREQIAE